MLQQEKQETEAESRLKPEVASGARSSENDAQLRASGVQFVAHDLLAGRPQADNESVSNTARELISLALPIAAAMLGEVALGLVDTKLVGGLGTSALGGVGVATTIMFLFYSLVFGLMRSVKVLTAHAVGRGQEEDGVAFAWSGSLIGFAVGCVVLVLCRDIGPALTFCGIDATVVPFARDFAAAVTLGAPAACALAALVQHRQAIGDSRTPMIVGLGGNVVNAFVAWCLIYGHFGFPALGVRGGGYSTAVVEVLELAVLAFLLVRHEKRRRASGGRATPLTFRRASREIAGIGVPTGLQFGTEMLAFTTFTAVIGGIGKPEIAAHQIAIAIIRVSFLPGIAISEAASVLVGRALGRRRIDEAEHTTRHALKVAVGFMALCGVAFAVLGGLISELFSSDPEVKAIARRLLFVAAIFQVLDAVNIVLRGSLRGAKDIRATAIIGIVAVWGCVPTSAYLLGKLAGLGAVGGWIGFIGETSIAATLLWMRWTKGAWRLRYAENTPENRIHA